jgi:hypothetical protein
VREFVAEPIAKIEHAPRDAEPAVLKRRRELRWRRRPVPEPVDVGLLLLVEDARGPVHERSLQEPIPGEPTRVQRSANTWCVIRAPTNKQPGQNRQQIPAGAAHRAVGNQL